MGVGGVHPCEHSKRNKGMTNDMREGVTNVTTDDMGTQKNFNKTAWPNKNKIN